MSNYSEAFDLILPYLQPIAHLLQDASVSDVMVRGQHVFVDRTGSLELVPGIAIDLEHLDAAIQNIARLLGDDITREKPILDARLPDGSRVGAVYPPVSPTITMTIRRFGKHFSAEDLVASGSLPPEVLEYVDEAIDGRRNVLVSGGTSSGKTTLLNAFIARIPEADSLVVIEKPIELRIDRPSAARWEAVEPRDGHPGISPATLVKTALRHRPDRIVMGEVRGSEAFDLLQAMNTGHSGTFSTIHADSAERSLYRLSSLALSAFPNLDHDFTRAETAAAIHFVVHVSRDSSGRRAVREMVRVTGYQDGKFLTTPIYKETPLSNTTRPFFSLETAHYFRENDLMHQLSPAERAALLSLEADQTEPKRSN